MRSSEHHHNLTNGVGKCSVPMWMGGLPSGFCDDEAYGKPEKDKFGHTRYGHYENGRWIDGYVPGLACPGHGGPKERAR